MFKLSSAHIACVSERIQGGVSDVEGAIHGILNHPSERFKPKIPGIVKPNLAKEGKTVRDVIGDFTTEAILNASAAAIAAGNYVASASTTAMKSTGGSVKGTVEMGEYMAGTMVQAAYLSQDGEAQAWGEKVLTADAETVKPKSKAKGNKSTIGELSGKQ